MNDAEIKRVVHGTLNSAVQAGLKGSLFKDSLLEDTNMILEEVLPDLPKSRHVVVELAIAEWRVEFSYLRGLPDAYEFGAVWGATSVGKCRNLLDKADRYELFEQARLPWRGYN